MESVMSETKTSPEPVRSGPAAGPSASGALPLATRRALMALIIGGVAAVLDTTIVSIALNSLVKALHSTVGQIQWVSTGYLLALGVVIPVVGWGQARFGGKRLWMAALTLFVAGSALCAVAWNAESLIGFRVLQGVGAGMIFPLMQTLAMQAARAAQGGNSSSSGQVVATVSLPIAIGPILGPVLGGVILNWLDWRWLFLVNVPVCAVGLYLAWRWLPADSPAAAGPRPRLDLPGLLLIAPGLAGILLGLSNVSKSGGFGRGDVQLPLIAGLVLLAAFVAWALRRTSTRRAGPALIDVRLLRIRSIGASCAVLFLTGACIYAAMFLLPLYWQELHGFSVLDAALLLIPQGVGSLATRTLAGKLTDRIGGRAVAVAGFTLIALATVPFAVAGHDTNEWWLAAVLLVRGLGLGAVMIPVMTVAFVDLDPAKMPHASMLTRISQQVGGSFGVAVGAVVLESVVASGHGPSQAFSQAFWWTIGFTVVAALASFVLPGRRIPASGQPTAAATTD
jgi:EmrB/QacA subfamily drug resistance transporter